MNEHLNGEEWIDRLLRGELNDTEKELLAEKLDLDKEFRQQFVEYIQWDSEMAEALRESRFSFVDTMSLATKNQLKEGKGRKVESLRVMLAVSAAIIVALVMSLVYQQAQGPTPPPAISDISGPSLSLIHI